MNTIRKKSKENVQQRIETIEDLVQFEQHHNLWDWRFLGYPLWVSIRPHFLANGIGTPKARPGKTFLRNFLAGVLDALWLFRTKEILEAIYFISARPDFLNFFRMSRPDRSMLFLVDGDEQISNGVRAHRGEFFQAVRMFFRLAYRSCRPVLYLANIGFLRGFDSGSRQLIVRHIASAYGDAHYWHLLKKYLRGFKGAIYYALAVIPPGARLDPENKIQLFELQHGIIHSSHPTYVKIPGLTSNLVCYHEKYINLLRTVFSGRLLHVPFKSSAPRNEERRHIVVFSQPIPRLQKAIDELFSRCDRPDIYIKRHPRDYYNYKHLGGRELKSVDYGSVDVGIAYFSTVIEDLALVGTREIIVLDVGELKKDFLNELISLMSRGSASKITMMTSVPETADYLLSLSR